MTSAFLIFGALAALALFIYALVANGYWPFRGRLETKSAPYKVELVEDLPDITQPLKLYLAGSDQNLWAAAMLCPCGCGDRIELNLLKSAKPCWTAKVHDDGTGSLSPSVWRQKGCGSHFFLRNGQIDWC